MSLEGWRPGLMLDEGAMVKMTGVRGCWTKAAMDLYMVLGHRAGECVLQKLW